MTKAFREPYRKFSGARSWKARSVAAVRACWAAGPGEGRHHWVCIKSRPRLARGAALMMRIVDEIVRKAPLVAFPILLPSD